MPLIDPVTMSAAGPASQAELSKSSLPIELLPNDLAGLITHIHPVLLLSAYYLRFQSLVANPVQSLLIALVPLAIVQSIYCLFCLPPAGSKQSKKVQKGKTGPGKKDGVAGPAGQIAVSSPVFKSKNMICD
jgi:phosphatidylinositol glycan class F